MLTLSAAAAARESVLLCSDWKFTKGDAGLEADPAEWETVVVPHTWNAVDGQNGKAADPQLPEGYYRGPAWYARKLQIPAGWKGKRIFLRFEAASLISDAYLNNKHLGQHRGAFAAFCYEITPYVRFDGENLLKVRVDNARHLDVAPLSGDFTVFGGLYRPVHLLATDPVCITPLDFASPGVYLTLKSVSSDEATVEAKALISNGLESRAKVRVEVEIKDAAGKTVARNSGRVTVPQGQTLAVVRTLRLAGPQLWHGRKSPYLYSVNVRVVRNGRVVDEVTQPLGIRTVAFSEEKGFLLNGEPYPLRGVNRHQDRRDKGWAVSPADHEQDIALILEMGTTALRLAHYQQCDYVHELCDRAGLIVWQEIPLVDCVGGSEAFLENARQQLTEMILQGYNHPSLCMWGLYNELDAIWAAVKTAPANPVIKNLQALAKQLDNSRPTVAASWMTTNSALHKIPDQMGFNIYPGWYWGKPSDFAATVDKINGWMDGRRVAISEYGAGANPFQHQEGPLTRPKHDGPFHPEQWQVFLHETQWEQARDNPKLWGTFIWNMFDFAVDHRNEGGIPGLNDKGLVTHDRRVKKDTFFFYKANWSEEPVLYIASRRHTERTNAVTDVKVFSNAAEAELFVNGVSRGRSHNDGLARIIWKEVNLLPGTNRIEVRAQRQGQSLYDQCEWILKSSATDQPQP